MEDKLAPSFLDWEVMDNGIPGDDGDVLGRKPLVFNKEWLFAIRKVIARNELHGKKGRHAELLQGVRGKFSGAAKVRSKKG